MSTHQWDEDRLRRWRDSRRGPALAGNEPRITPLEILDRRVSELTERVRVFETLLPRVDLLERKMVLMENLRGHDAMAELYYSPHSHSQEPKKKPGPRAGTHYPRRKKRPAAAAGSGGEEGSE